MSESQSTEEEQLVKSIHANNKSFVTFINRSKSPIDLVWRDYQGKYVRYRSTFSPGAYYHIDTYETHPWQAWSSRTQEFICIDGKQVYYPKPWRGEHQRTLVYIDDPVRSLRKLCLLEIQSIIKSEHVDLLRDELPGSLCDELKRRRQQINVTEHQS